MKVHFLPSTRAGKWACALALVPIVVFPLLYLFAERLHLLTDWLSSVIGSVSLLAGILAFIISLLAVLRSKDRALLVFFAGAVGLFILGFLLSMVLVDLL